MNNPSSNDFRCYELEEKLEPLFVFSSKLKHLQLSYKQYNELVEEVVLLRSCGDYDETSDEYYIMQLERMIIELLTSICSIRDCLKNRILDTEETENGQYVVNGNLCSSYSSLQTEHKKILSETLDKDDVNKNIRRLVETLRNKLNHSRLQKTRFLEVISAPKFESSKKEWWLICDYSHLVEEVLDLKNKDDVVWRYYCDHHLMCMQQAILGPEQLKFMEHRLISLNMPEIWAEVIGIIDKECGSLGEFSEAMHSHIVRQRIDDIHSPIYDRLLAHKEYCLFEYREYRKVKQNNPCTKPHQRMWFNIHLAINQIYKLYLDYYIQLHTLIFQYHHNHLKEFESLLLPHHKKELKRYYSCAIPENPHAEFVLQHKVKK